MNPPNPVRRGGLEAFFRPRSVAIVGASATPGKLGHTVVRNVVDGGFAGRVYAVNPSGTAIAGARSAPDLASIGEKVDLAFLAVPASRARDAVRDCAAAGVRAVVIGASGFAELGTQQGRALQDEIAAIAGSAGMRVIGPNTNGLLDVHGALSLGYNASHSQRFMPGQVSVLSHSGALFDGIAKRLQGYGAGLAKFVAVGNELDVTLLELLESLVDDNDTKVVGLVIEGLSDGPRLRAAAQQLAHAGKHVVALKIGRSREGAGAALAHSSRLAGSSRAWDALLRACGFASVRTVEALAGACAVLSQPRSAAGDQRLLCITTSGAGGAMLADLAVDRGIPLAPQWDGKAGETIGRLPTAAAIRHPIDMGSLGDWALLQPVLDALEADGLRGPTAVYAHVAPAPGMAEHLADALLARRARCAQPMVVLAPGGLGAEVEARYTAAGIPVFHDAVTCFDSLAAHYQPAPEPLPDAHASPIPGVDALLQKAGRGMAMSELHSSELLRLAGVPLVPSAVAYDVDEAAKQARNTGFPLVLKALAAGVAHKHKAGLVALGISGEGALRAAFEQQSARLRALGASARETPFLLQPMVKGDLELIAGLSLEPGLGHFLVWGLGGVHAEVFDQVDLLALPSTQEMIQRQVTASRTGRILAAVDASGGALQGFVAALQSLQGLAGGHGSAIQSVDINPVLVTGAGVMAVDALVVTA